MYGFQIVYNTFTLWLKLCVENMFHFKFKECLGYLNPFALDCTFGHRIFWLCTVLENQHKKSHFTAKIQIF